MFNMYIFLMGTSKNKNKKRDKNDIRVIGNEFLNILLGSLPLWYSTVSL